MGFTTDDEMFIEIVRSYPELYDPNNPLYDDRPRRDIVWREIGKKMHQPASSCRDRWKRMRDNYRRAQKLRTEKYAKMKGDVAKNMSCPRNERLLSFLNPFLGNLNEKVSYVPILEYYDSSNDNNSLLEEMHSTDISTITSASSSRDGLLKQQPSSKRKSVDLAVEPEQVFLEQKYDTVQPKRNKVVDFFTNLGETVKDFPEDVQIRVKREAFRIVSEAEEMVYNNKLKADVHEIIIKEDPL